MKPLTCFCSSRRLLETLKIFLAILILFPTTTFAENFESIVDARFVKLQTFENGQEAVNMVVNLSVFKSRGKLAAIWESIYIREVDVSGKKKTLLTTFKSTSDDPFGINNIIRTNDTVSFDLFLSAGRVMKIICRKIGDYEYDIKGKSYYWSETLKKDFVEEWSVTEKIVMPSLELY